MALEGGVRRGEERWRRGRERGVESKRWRGEEGEVDAMVKS
jgi:hypothetical protein